MEYIDLSFDFVILIFALNRLLRCQNQHILHPRRVNTRPLPRGTLPRKQATPLPRGNSLATPLLQAPCGLSATPRSDSGGPTCSSGGLPVNEGIPVRVSCTSCRADIMTATTFETGTMTWLLVGILCIIGCWPCCLIPFCVDGCKDVIHTCPNCQAQVGVYRRM